MTTRHNTDYQRPARGMERIRTRWSHADRLSDGGAATAFKKFIVRALASPSPSIDLSPSKHRCERSLRSLPWTMSRAVGWLVGCLQLPTRWVNAASNSPAAFTTEHSQFQGWTRLRGSTRHWTERLGGSSRACRASSSTRVRSCRLPVSRSKSCQFWHPMHATGSRHPARPRYRQLLRSAI